MQLAQESVAFFIIIYIELSLRHHGVFASAWQKKCENIGGVVGIDIILGIESIVPDLRDPPLP